MDEQPTKRCARCGEDKPLSEWYRNRARADGLSGYCAACQIAADKTSRGALRDRAIDYLGGKCAECGYEDRRALQFDHRDGGGTALRETGDAGAKLYRAVLAGSDVYVLLCANCNLIKKSERGEVVGRRVYRRSPPTERRPTSRVRTPEQRAAVAEKVRGYAERDPAANDLRKQRISESVKRAHAEGRGRWGSRSGG